MRSGLVLVMGMFLAFAACERGDVNRTSAAPEDQNDYQEQQRDQYISSVNAKLDEMENKIDGLEQRADAMEGTAKDQFNQSIKSLRDEKEVVADKLDDLDKVSINSWTTMKGEVDSALSHLESSYDQVSASHEVVKP